VVRLHGTSISNEDAGELARWLRASSTETGTADRIDRAIDAGGGLIATSRPEAWAILTVIAAIGDDDPALIERLEGVVVDLRRYIG
jgi:hypothetical protein